MRFNNTPFSINTNKLAALETTHKLRLVTRVSRSQQSQKPRSWEPPRAFFWGVGGGGGEVADCWATRIT